MRHKNIYALNPHQRMLFSIAWSAKTDSGADCDFQATTLNRLWNINKDWLLSLGNECQGILG